LRDKEIRHTTAVTKDQMKETALRLLTGIGRT